VENFPGKVWGIIHCICEVASAVVLRESNYQQVTNFDCCLISVVVTTRNCT